MTIATFTFENDQEEWQYYQNELLSELNKQFYKDGTNFEGSSHYSAFVTEALIICRLVIDEMDKNSVIIQQIDEIIKSNSGILKFLKNKLETGVIFGGKNLINLFSSTFWCM